MWWWAFRRIDPIAKAFPPAVGEILVILYHNEMTTKLPEPVSMGRYTIARLCGLTISDIWILVQNKKSGGWCDKFGNLCADLEGMHQRGFIALREPYWNSSHSINGGHGVVLTITGFYYARERARMKSFFTFRH